MKKFLRIVGLLILLIVLVVLGAGLVASKNIKVESTVSINAPEAVVANQMLHYKNFHNWSPWQELDTNMTTTVTGEDGHVGAKYAWKGNKKVGEGEMTMKEVKDGMVQYELNFIAPWEAHAEGTWEVKTEGAGKSSATWTYTTHANFPMNGIMKLMGMKKMLAGDFDKGLNKLKAYCEAHANDDPGDFTITETQFPGHTYATLRKTINIDNETMMKFFGDSYQQLGKAANSRISGPASCLAYKWDEANKTADLAAAFPVTGNEAVNGATMVTVAPSKACMIALKGGYAQFEKAHAALQKYVASKNETPTMVIEEYIKGPNDDKDSTNWLSNIYYLTN